MESEAERQKESESARKRGEVETVFVKMHVYFIGSSLSSFLLGKKKNNKKPCSDDTDILKQYAFYS